MMDMAAAILILCFVVGIASSALFVASFYLYRESRRCYAPTRTEAVATHLESAPTDAAGVSQLEVEAGHRVISTSAFKRMEERVSDTISTCGGSSETSSNCSYTCEVCGSCCAGDRRRLNEHQLGQGDNCQRTLPANPCGEFFVSSVDVGFKCQAGTDSGGRPGGTFFFFRGRQLSELLEPVAPSKRYLTMAAVPSVPYHLWFCSGQQHSAKSLRCPNCRPVFIFELCDSEILFHRSRKRLPRCVWLLAYEETSGSSSVIYRGDAGSLTTLQYTDKLFVYFGLPSEAGDLLPGWLPCAGLMKHLVCCGLSAEDSSRLDNDSDKSAQGVLVPSAATAGDPPDLLLRKRLRRGRLRVSSGNDGICDLNRKTDDEKDSDTNDSNNTDSLNNDIGKELTPLSMGSMRKAARWPITQFENVIESSSSEEPVFPLTATDTEVQHPSPLPPPPPPLPPPPPPVQPQDESNIDTSMTCEIDRFSIRLENFEDG